MEKLHTLGKKISSTKQMQSVVKTMKSLAAVNIRQYESAVESLREYNETVTMGLRAVLEQNRYELSRMKVDPRRGLGLIVIGAEQGMAGQFDEVVLRKADEYINDIGITRSKIRAIALGERVAAGLGDKNIEIAAQIPIPGSIEDIASSLHELVEVMVRWAREEGFGRITAIYNRPKSGISYEAVSARLIPLSRDWIASLLKEPRPTRTVPLIHGSWREVYGALLREYVFASLVKAIIESMAAENASRLATMQAAEKNIKEHLEDLTAQFNRQRQSSITSELLDIVAGFEALTKS